MIMRSCGGGLLNVTASDEIQRIDGNLMPSVNFPRLPGHREESGRDHFETFSSSVVILAILMIFWPTWRCLFLASRRTTMQSTVNVAGSVVLTIFSVKSAARTNISALRVQTRCSSVYTTCMVHALQCRWEMASSRKCGDHSHDFFGLLPAHNEAKGPGCHLQRVADGAGRVAFEAADVLVGDLEPRLLDIIDLRRGKSRAVRGSVAWHVSRSRQRALL